MSFSVTRTPLARTARAARSLATQAQTTAEASSSASPSSSELPPSIQHSPAPPSSPSVQGQYLPTGALSPHSPIPPKHRIHVATLHLRSHTTSLPQLTFFTSFALRSARALGLPTSGAISLPTKTSLFTTPRSPFAHKKSQQNFWRKEHKRAVKVWDGNEEVVGAWLAYLRKEAMGGVGMKAQVITYREVGWGGKMADLSEEMRSSALEVEGSAEDGDFEAADVEALAQELMSELKTEAKAMEEQTKEIEEEQKKGEKRVLEEASEETSEGEKEVTEEKKE